MDFQNKKLKVCGMVVGFALFNESYDIDDDDAKRLIEWLLELGALEVQGFDERTNDIKYTITEKCKEIMPELFNEHFKFINQLAFDMWKLDLIEMTFDMDGTPMVMLKPETVKIKDTLPDDQRVFVENMLNKYESNRGDII